MSAMHRIFISYRRSDSESFSGRLRDRLRAEFGKRSVFMDTSTIMGGDRFDKAIARNLTTCKVVVAVIGKTWLTCADDKGNRRLDDAEDWVRKELEQALGREDLLVIPVVFGGAVMPPKASLPESLQPLAMHNAVPISDADFDSDVAKLIEACEPHVPRPRRWPWIAGAVAALALGIGGYWYFDSTRLVFSGVYIVPDQPFYRLMPEEKGRKRKFYLSLSSGGKQLGIHDFTRKSVFIVGESGLDAPRRPQDIASLTAEFAQHYKSKGIDDYDAVAARLSSDPIVVSMLRVRPGARVHAEIGVVELDAAGKPAQQPRALCEFAIPETVTTATPIYYLTRTSSECRPAD
jgi:hypothetical protein